MQSIKERIIGSFVIFGAGLFLIGAAAYYPVEIETIFRPYSPSNSIYLRVASFLLCHSGERVTAINGDVPFDSYYCTDEAGENKKDVTVYPYVLIFGSAFGLTGTGLWLMLVAVLRLLGAIVRLLRRKSESVS